MRRERERRKSKEREAEGKKEREREKREEGGEKREGGEKVRVAANKEQLGDIKLGTHVIQTSPINSNVTPQPGGR